MSFEDRVAAVGIATEFQDNCGQVFKVVDEDTDNAKTQSSLT
ncbi:magnesium-chelatase subunit ChlD chloroplastic-like [Trifolium medium]|uniref:Magnesium-chelatase subunit ChlD chloroplastic-like n=1 Tax=Trifolium medium TaxID=97028 RepID=A0A392S2X7_9FABA|nr:magnesium-chelatase subunit ChlD chloroplastic-like [Trifolium medium]